MRHARFIPVALWTALILKLLLSPVSGVPKFPWLQFPHSDKLVHASLFAIGSVLFLIGFGKSETKEIPRKPITLIAIWVLSVGTLTECLQHCCVVTRSGDPLDLLADVAGGFLPLTWLMRSK